MVKTLLGQVKQYKKASLLTPLFTALEVVMEVLIPLVISLIIDRGIEAGNIQQIYFYGGIMVIMAMASLIFGILAGKYAASASSGLACNLREEMYGNIQRFSFSNIDKYSTAGLVTRLTTDVTNVQNAYQRHGHVLFHQYPAEPGLCGGHRGSRTVAGIDYFKDH